MILSDLETSISDLSSEEKFQHVKKRREVRRNDYKSNSGSSSSSSSSSSKSKSQSLADQINDLSEEKKKILKKHIS